MAALPIIDVGDSPPLCSYRNVRAMVGPHASKERLIASLSGSSAQSLQWAVNTYFRSIFSEGVHGTELKLKLAASESKPCSAFPVKIKWTSWPVELVIRCAQYLDVKDLLSLASTNSQMREAITVDRYYSALLWGALAEAHCYSAAGISVVPNQLVVCGGVLVRGQPSALLSLLTEGHAYAAFREVFVREKTQTCLKCSSPGSMVPVVYGFPSHQLLENFNRRRLKFGGDNLIDGLPAWCCLSCSTETFSYPYKVGTLKVGSSQQELGRARYRGARAMPWSFGQTPP